MEKWPKENRLTCSEGLGDIIREHDLTLASSVYLRANVPNKIVACFAETGRMDKIVLYSKKVGYDHDHVTLLQHVMRTDPGKCAEFTAQPANDEGGPLVDIERVVDIFTSRNVIEPAPLLTRCAQGQQGRARPPTDASLRVQTCSFASSRRPHLGQQNALPLKPPKGSTTCAIKLVCCCAYVSFSHRIAWTLADSVCNRPWINMKIS